MMDKIDEAYHRILDRMESQDIATRDQLRGCSREEIVALERRYGVLLPRSYRRYLEVMGHASGRLLRYGHLAATYPYVLEVTEEQRKGAAEEGALARLDELLGEDGLIITGSLGEDFLFIRCADPEDSAVYGYDNVDYEPEQRLDSVLDYVDLLVSECAEAIRDGYFDTYPEGTSP